MILLICWDMSFCRPDIEKPQKMWPLWTKAQWPRFSYQQAVKFFWNLDRAKEKSGVKWAQAGPLRCRRHMVVDIAAASC